MSWLNCNSNALQTIAAIIAALVAIVALIGIKFQVDASYRVQSANEIYRELLNISVAKPWQVQLLSGLPKIEESPYVILGDFEGQHFSDMQKP
jgi:hypothetical protein